MIGIAIASSPVRRRLRYLGVGVELAAPENRQDGDSHHRRPTRWRAGQHQSSWQAVARGDLNIQPSLIERPGLPVRIIVNRDPLLSPYQPQSFNGETAR